MRGPKAGEMLEVKDQVGDNENNFLKIQLSINNNS